MRLRENFLSEHIIGLLAVFIIATGVLSLPACTNEDSEPPQVSKTPIEVKAVKPKVFLLDSLDLRQVEQSAEVLSVWRQFAQQKPTLLLLSNNPMLQPVPEQLREEVAGFTRTATQADLARRGNLLHSDPLFSSAMTTDAALRANLFDRLVWAIPRRGEDRTLELEEFRRQMLSADLINKGEADTLTVSDQGLSGQLRELPFQAVIIPNLPKFAGPLVVHIDLSYFQQMYKSEISTPVLEIIYDTLRQLRERKLQVLAVTFAYGNLEDRISLDVRYLGDVLKQLIASPAELDQPAPLDWQRQGTIIALANLFQKDKAREVALALATENEDKAWVKFTLYRSAQQNGQGDEALVFLDEAVALDKVFALEYATLAEKAYDRRQPHAALQILQKASVAFPDNHFLQLKLAQLSRELGDLETASSLLKNLRKLTWSSTYYPDMPDYLKAFEADIMTQ